ncbi:MAG: hypothetical protein LAO21_03270 [Acidobacteriia bacterium]|nr:hypothetical protein [Terriglobia bacterium]
MKPEQLKLSGILFLIAGVAFFAAYLFSKQVAFVGVGAAFFAIGSFFIAKSRNNPPV